MTVDVNRVRFEMANVYAGCEHCCAGLDLLIVCSRRDRLYGLRCVFRLHSASLRLVRSQDIQVYLHRVYLLDARTHARTPTHTHTHTHTRRNLEELGTERVQACTRLHFAFALQHPPSMDEMGRHRCR